MRSYLQGYLSFIDKELESTEIPDIENLKKELLTQIQFMQHERLIHLIVTVLFAIMLFICIGIFAVSDKAIFALLTFLILLPLVPYIWHYYFMENSVQKMYVQYNKLCLIQKESALKDLPAVCTNIKPSKDI